MTIMAAEAGTAAFEGEASDATVAGRRAAERRKTPRKPGRTGGRTQQGTQAYVPVSRRQPARAQSAARPAAPAVAASPSQPRRQRAGGRSRSAPQFLTGRTSTNYRSVIVGELLLAILLVATTPFARKNQGQVSPYSGQDLLQLLAITVVYFILAVVAGTGQAPARFAAWFGGLILLAIGLGETAGLVHTLAIFGGSNAAPPAASAATVQKNLPNSSTVNANPVGGSADTGIPSRGSQQSAETPPSASGSGSG